MDSHCSAHCCLHPQRLLGQHEEVHVLGVGTGVSSAASVVELLKSDGLALVISG